MTEGETTMSSDLVVKPRRRRWLRHLIIASATLAVLGSASAYVGYRLMFRKNPEAVRQMKAAEQRQQDIEAAFSLPDPGS
jgi:hypothetical protein